MNDVGPAGGGLVGDARQKRPVSRRQLLFAALAILLVLILAVIQVSSIIDNRRLRTSIDSSYDRQFMLQRLLSLHQDVETGQRGYTLTGNPEFLQPFNRALPQISKTFAELKRETMSADARGHIRTLETLSAQKIDISRRVIETRRSGDAESARKMIATARGKRVMDRFRGEVGILQAGETNQLEGLLRSSAKSNGEALASTAAIEAALLLMLAVAFAANAANVRRLRHATAAARDSSRRQAAIFDAASDAMLVLDQKWCVEGLNPAAFQLFSIAEGQGIGRIADELFELEGADFAQILSDSSAGHLRHLIGCRADGSRFEAEVASSRVGLGNEFRTLLIVRDATERNRVERMKNEFVSTVSHELRTPLTSIRGALALFEHSAGADLAERPTQLLKIAKSNTERLTVLVDDILDIEKIGSGRFELDCKPTDIRDIVELARDQNQTYASDRGVSLDVTSSEEPLMVSADESRMLQAFTNLISNAAKFSPPSGTVTLVAQKAGKVARVSVADQGPGIPVEFRSQVFNRFAQASGHSSRRAGTGLGLAITKAIVEAHGGTIDYETEVGKGTKFWIDLPLARKGKK